MPTYYTGSVFYPYASGSLYTASFAATSSYAVSASYRAYVTTASFAITGSKGPVGFRGSPDICLITTEQYLKLVATSSLREVCNFPPR